MYPDCWNCNLDCSVHECKQKISDLEKKEMIKKKLVAAFKANDYCAILIDAQKKSLEFCKNDIE